ncbi:chemotaxis protein [Vibrio cholerae]|uniref:chemotaxis protein n=1 Tax=Vibrio TaxID=662 RepID=UPI000DE4BC8B|nr:MULTISPECIES: chemotaxis protein [Vibrio]EGR0541926.1 chemotaxis protein [Vibrio cholerae]EJL6705313.1 chemotaxis protein [Vibrio cholerae]EKF9261423.1 chemotaxis protein [Vibrio cholerae]EKF9384333.1 chemotaxis protein [Vibrio cholerae]EKF9917173.1 chemotaxis protein [Vibrio cholerae]
MPLPFILAGAAIVAAGYGAKKGYDGYQDKSEANDILDTSRRKYENERSVFDKQNELTNQSLVKLGELQLKIGNDFKEFRTIAEKLLEKLNQSNSKNLEIDFPQHKLDKIDGLALSTTAYIGKIAGAGAAGAAAAYAVYGGVMAVAAASTGTPIAALSGAAAYNATMAAIGGGSIAAGGFGMAGGAMVLGGVVAAPIMAIAGWAFASHAEEALSDARKTRSEVNEAVGKMAKGRKQLDKTKLYVDRIYAETERLYLVFKEYFDNLKAFDRLIAGNTDISKFEDDVIRLIHNGYQIAAILTDIITTPLFKPKQDEQGNVVVSDKNIVEIEMDSEGMQVINESAIDAVLTASSITQS